MIDKDDLEEMLSSLLIGAISLFGAATAVVLIAKWGILLWHWL